MSRQPPGTGLIEQPRTYGVGDRIFWWAKVLGAVMLVAAFVLTAGIAAGKWGFTRASVDYMDEQVATRATVETVKRIEKKLDTQQQVLGNVRDNVIMGLSRRGLKEKPLPEQVLEDLNGGNTP